MALASGNCGSDGCVVECNKRVYVKLLAKPEVFCKADNLNASIPVELDIKVKPRCHISEVQIHKGDKNCHHRCLFNVDIFAECDARVIANPCESQIGKVDLFFRAPVKTECLSDGEHGHGHGHGHGISLASRPAVGSSSSTKETAFFKSNKTQKKSKK